MNMAQEDPDNQGLAGRLASFRPSVNWNRASGPGIRTLLRRSKSGTVLTRTATTSPAENNEYPVTIVETESSNENEVNVAAANTTPLKPEAVPLPESAQPTNDHSEDSEAMNRSADSADSDKAEEIALNVTDENAIHPVLQNKPVLEQPLTQRLHISNIPKGLSERDVDQLFTGYSVTKIDLLASSETPNNEAYVEILGSADAQHALDALEGTSLDGRALIDIKLSVGNTLHESTTSSDFAPTQASHTSSKAGSVVQLIRDGESAAVEEAMASDEDGEVHESGQTSSRGQNTADESGELEDHTESEEGEVVETPSDKDAMVAEYSNADQSPKVVDGSSSKSEIEIIDLRETDEKAASYRNDIDGTTGPKTLAELTPVQLELQVRYFYVGRDPTTIPDTDPVHCTVCNKAGHMDAWCSEHICKHCDAKGLHFSRACPKIGRCGRCRGHHSVTECKHKLKPFNLVIICDLCDETGHVEADCELTWRTSGPLWKKPLPPLSVVRTCFICGDSGHLGNDCRLRQPGKAMGSSMWSEKGLPYPFTPLTTSADRPIAEPTGSKKNKHKMPNAKAKGVSAAPTKMSGNVQQSSFPLPAKLAINNPANKAKGKATRSIQIKGLASRSGLDTPPYSGPQTLGNHPIYRDQQHTSYHGGPGSNQSSRRDFPPDRRYTTDSGGGFPRGRNENERYRSRSRSRSPRGRYQVPLRSAGYGPPSRDYRDRDDPRYAGSSWRHGDR